MQKTNAGYVRVAPLSLPQFHFHKHFGKCHSKELRRMHRVLKMQPKKVSLASLPLPPVSRLLTHNLTPDPVTGKDPSSFLKVIQTTPSFQRRARLIDQASHFSYVTPLPIPFPFAIEFPEEIEDKKEFIEAWLSHREATEPVGDNVASSDIIKDNAPIVLTKHTSEDRIQERELLGVSSLCVQDCFPQLEIGDSLKVIGQPSLTAQSPSQSNGDTNGIEKTTEADKNEASKARQELLDILSGHTILTSFPDSPDSVGYAPWSLRYSGHQFGQWAGQLGDGRAISILEVASDDSPSGVYELQLKGAGRTPFSRSADGLAVVRSSIREYLCAEAMHALGVPTTRSLALTHLPTLPVRRERIERAAVVTRVAPSFIRIGSFEALNPPEQLFFLGGGQQPADLEALRVLGEYVTKLVLKLDVKSGEPWAQKLLMECAKRNAIMVAGWQTYGFMHGVINTDNVSIMGLTIDYGPYAFMDVFDPSHICNHSDDGGRYSYKLQPTMIIYALRCLLSALAPIIGAEIETGKAVSAGWSKKASEDRLSEWTKTGLDIQVDMEKQITETFTAEYNRLMRKRLGLKAEKKEDFSTIISPLLELLERKELDYPSTLRHLVRFHPGLMQEENSAELQSLLNDIDVTSQCSKPDGVNDVHSEWKQWLEMFAKRIEEDKLAWIGGDISEDNWAEKRKEKMERANPRFILRQWLLEEVIGKVEKDPETGKRVLAKVLEMATRPFDKWGAEGVVGEESLDEEMKEERRYCSLGDQSMLGFQCSCSS